MVFPVGAMVLPVKLPIESKADAKPGALPAAKAVNPVLAAPAKTPTIIVIDESFTKPDIDIDGNGSPDVSHGRAVANIIKTTLPDAQIHEFELKDDFVKAIDKLIASGVRPDAINLSITTWDKDKGEATTIPRLAEITGLPLTRQNLGKYKKEIHEKLDALLKADPKTLTKREAAYAATWEFSKKIQALTRHNIPIYIGAGNDGTDQINLTSLVDGTTTVGAKHWWGIKTGYTPIMIWWVAFPAEITGAFPL